MPTRISNMYPGSSGSSRGQNYMFGGMANNKWQGIAANLAGAGVVGGGRSYAPPEDRRKVFIFNALGGVGRMRSQFLPGGNTGGPRTAPDSCSSAPCPTFYWYKAYNAFAGVTAGPNTTSDGTSYPTNTNISESDTELYAGTNPETLVSGSPEELISCPYMIDAVEPDVDDDATNYITYLSETEIKNTLETLFSAGEFSTIGVTAFDNYSSSSQLYSNFYIDTTSAYWGGVNPADGNLQYDSVYFDDFLMQMCAGFNAFDVNDFDEQLRQIKIWYGKNVVFKGQRTNKIFYVVQVPNTIYEAVADASMPQGVGIAASPERRQKIIAGLQLVPFNNFASC